MVYYRAVCSSIWYITEHCAVVYGILQSSVQWYMVYYRAVCSSIWYITEQCAVVYGILQSSVQ